MNVEYYTTHCLTAGTISFYIYLLVFLSILFWLLDNNTNIIIKTIFQKNVFLFWNQLLKFVYKQKYMLFALQKVHNVAMEFRKFSPFQRIWFGLYHLRYQHTHRILVHHFCRLIHRFHPLPMIVLVKICAQHWKYNKFDVRKYELTKISLKPSLRGA